MNNNDFENEYKYGFRDKDVSIYNTGKGLSREVIVAISKSKGEPKWMLDYRLKAYEHFVNTPMPNFGADLSELNFDDYTYFIKPSEKVAKSWDDVPESIKDTFNKLGIKEAEQKFLSGVSTQYESEVVYHSMLKEVEEKGIIFLDTDTALREHPELVREYIDTVVPYTDNKFAALNSAVWSGGSFIYIPKNTKLDKPLQSYFRINSPLMGQFERTLIIVDEGSEVHYVEGCSAPIYSSSSLHAAVVEIIVKKDAKCRYSTIQNWSNNIVNLVTKRALVKENGLMEWIDGNIGSKINMKYPACILSENRAKGVCISVAVASNTQYQDAGAKMIHLAPNTSSSIISKSIAKNGGVTNYRGLVRIGKNATNSRSSVECDTL
ncbi:TPA: Fe-S cluster assembly protein SufB, partial [bacterium]|nr:Fe-S cluster assembly protein SufB [bacterium]